jgi:spore maturation protein CgeB
LQLKLNVIFFNSKTFLNIEVLSALRRRQDIRTLCVDIPPAPHAHSAQTVFDQLKPHLPAVVVSLNDAGFDQAGVLGSLLARTGSYQLNWYYDDPLYENIFHKRVIRNLAQRIDFVSENSFVALLSAKGRRAHFLPLATDPAYFNTDAPLRDRTYDITFVGNSSLEFMDGLMTGPLQRELDKAKDLLGRLKSMYYNDPRADLRSFLLSHRALWPLSPSIDPDAFVFALPWMVGYLYRKDFVIDLANTYADRFACFGDPYWTNFISKSQVSTDAMYYKNLCSYYRSSKINININRIQTLTSFTQRVFDCKASGAFLLTDRRAMNSAYFVTDAPDRELVEYDSLDHCKKLIDYYLTHDDERRRIALAGRDTVLAHHTYDNRIDEMLTVAGKTWAELRALGREGSSLQSLPT